MATHEIYEKSPTRVDLAGGTLDCWPLYLFLKDPQVVSIAVDIFTHCWIEPHNGKEITLISEDQGVRKSYSNLSEVLNDDEKAFSLVRVCLAYFAPTSGFNLRTKSESPVGAGLGGSSSLCISIIKAFCKWLGRPMDPHRSALIASHLEAQLLRAPTGTQDYFPPMLGGLCLISYGVEGPRALGRDLPRGIFDERFVLVNTGRSHNSGINNWQVIKSGIEGDTKVLLALENLSQTSAQMRLVFEHAQWEKLPELFTQEYKYRIQLTEAFLSPEILRLKNLADSLGAVAKICGAGGGGCVMIWSQDRRAKEIRSLCSSEGFEVMAARPWEPPH